LLGKLLDSKKLEDYLRLTSRYGYFSLVPEGASNIRVSNIKKMSGGMTNNTCSFLLTFNEKGFSQHIDLVMKAYSEKAGLWSKVHHADEDVRPYVREFQALKSLRSVDFPVPSVYLCECDSFFFGYPFLIMNNEKVMQESVFNLDCFASTLARLHNLKVKELKIQSLRVPNDEGAFAKERQICLKHYLNETRHYRNLKKDFNYAINWLESNAADNNCPKYCLIHGEYHPGHALLTNDNILKIIDWESVQIGDPAFDVGYAYHMIKLMYNDKKSNSGEGVAERFVSEYSRNFQGDVHKRLEFYKVVGLLGIAVVVSSWISNPLEAYRGFGYKSLARALAFPFFRSQFLVKKWLNSDFLVSYLQYSQDFINTTLKR
jgi:aminoglycoside phosphotransferase (APT) family kinase protein